MTLSVIIPYYNDLDVLKRLFTRLQFYREYIDRIVLVDGSDDSNCRALCERMRALYIPSPKACRGYQLNLGAAQADDGFLFFMHADARPTRHHFAALDHNVKVDEACFFRFRFSGKSRLIKRIFEQLIQIRVKLGTPYVDQGLVIHKQLFIKAGGFASEPLFEEVPLIRFLRQGGHLRSSPLAFLVDARKYESQGYIKRAINNRLLALQYMLGIPSTRLAARYAKQSRSL